MKCLLDLDGVLVDLMGPLYKIFKITNPPPGEYDLSISLKVPQHLIWEHKIVKHPDFWACLPKMPEADLIVELMTKHFGEENICILTSPVKDPNCAAGKMRWIQKNFKQFKRSFLIGPAKEFVAGPDKFLVDDCEANVEKFEKHGGEGILVPAMWNRDYMLRNNVVETLSKRLP